MPPSRFDGFRLFVRGEYVYAVCEAAAKAAEGLDCQEMGLQLMKLTHSGHHKPTSRGMQTFGGVAAENVLDVTSAEVRALVEGRKVEAPGMQGFVILRMEGRAIGVGLCREGRLESQFPRSMTEHLTIYG